MLGHHQGSGERIDELIRLLHHCLEHLIAAGTKPEELGVLVGTRGVEGMMEDTGYS